jgi:Mn2+/Fe2+ NRAMP family transporter
MAIGVVISVSGINPMRALYWAAVINAVISVPIMVAVMLAATRRKVMGDLVVPQRRRVLGWLATAAMTLASCAMFGATL